MFGIERGPAASGQPEPKFRSLIPSRPYPPAEALVAALLAFLATLAAVVMGPLWPVFVALLAGYCAYRQPTARLVWVLCALVCVHVVFAMSHRTESRLSTRLSYEARTVRVEEVLPGSPPRLLLSDNIDQRRYRVGAWGEYPELYPGQCLIADLRLRPPVASVNFHGFDYGRWLYLQNIDATGSLKKAVPCREDGSRAQEAVEAANPTASFWQHLGAETPGQALMRALLLADRSAFTSHTWEVLSRTGTSHLFAISGLHVGLIAFVSGALGYGMWWLLAPLQRRGPRRRIAIATSILGVLLYMSLAWEQVSAQRAGFMAIVGLGMMLRGRRVPLLQIWALALLVVLAWDPFAALSPATVLSFSACLLLIALAPQLKGRSFFTQLVFVQLGLGVGLASLTAAFFGHVSLLGFVLNLFLVPALSLFLPASLLALGVAKMSWLLPLQLCIGLLDGVFHFLAQWAQGAWAVLPVPNLGFGLAAALFLLALAFVAYPLRRQRTAAGASFALLLVFAIWPKQGLENGQARLWVLDVGQGQSVVVQTAKSWVVIDPGPRSPRGSFDAGAMIVAPHLRALGAGQVDLLVTTHGDSDHAGGLSGLAAQAQITEQWGPGERDCEQGLSWVADGVHLRSLPLGALPSWSDNNRSCVVLLEVGGRQFLFTGDIERVAEVALLKAWPELRGVDALTVPHHGSLSSSSAEFVAAMRPGFALVSAGTFNRWNFPRPEVTSRWREQGATVLSTESGGAIQLDLPSMRIRRPSLRPWHRLVLETP